MTFLTTHTPAPWHVVGRGNGRQQLPIRSSAGTEIAVLTHGHLVDAYLLAAAPDLLEALKALVDYEDDEPVLGTFGAEVYTAARAAIAKAKGEITP